MSWKMALPMYNVSARIQRDYETLLAALVAQAGLAGAVELVRDARLPEIWRRTDTLLSQTCGYPYMHSLRDYATLIATPCFDLPGCQCSDYSSAIVIRSDSGIRSLAEARGRVAAANERHSNSGMNVLRHAVAPLAREGRFFGAVKWSGSHAASLRLVREGAADIAAIDCVTYAYLREEDPASVDGLSVLAYSAPSPGLPLIGSSAASPGLLNQLRRALLEPGGRLSEAMQPLRIHAFRYCPETDYARIVQLGDQASAMGYPELA
jgi:ABC-type phosphate/phosphonate transport system substrate-binding protein